MTRWPSCIIHSIYLLKTGKREELDIVQHLLGLLRIKFVRHIPIQTWQHQVYGPEACFLRLPRLFGPISRAILIISSQRRGSKPGFACHYSWSSAFQNKRVTVWQVAVRAPKALGSMEKQVPGAYFSKVPKLFGRISGDIILFVSSKLRRLEARNFAVIFIFIPFTTYEKTSFTE